MILNYIRLLRIHQWVKNLFVFAPIFFGLRLFDWRLMQLSVQAFLAFCCVASSMYILNDILDVKADRQHPAKRMRPVASGAVSVKKALIPSIILAFFGLALAYRISLLCVFIILGYVIINVAYSFKLKHIAIVDILCIAIGFVLRVFMGSFATGVALSHWIIVMTFLLATFLALSKRRDDLILFSNGNNIRKAIEGYNLKLIDILMSVVAAVILVAYLMYSFSPEVIAYFGSQHVYLTFIFVFLGIMRYLQITFVFEETASPTNILLKDRFLQMTIIGWLIAFMIILYKP